MEMIRLENIDYLWGLATIPFAGLLFLLSRLAYLRMRKKFGDSGLVSKLIPDASPYKAYLKFVIWILAFSSLVVAVANPQVGSKLEEFKREGVDVIIALDISNSMLAEDIKPNRLERARLAVSNLIDELKNDRIGIILFAGTSFLQLPLTMDYSAAKLMLASVSPEIIPTQGTAIGSAIDLAMESYPEENEQNKALIIITDGENHEDDALGKAAEAAERDIVIHTIGMGSVEGAPIPKYRGKSKIGFRKDNSGSTVVSKLDASMLQQISAASNGRFIRSQGADPQLSKLVDEIGKMDKTEFETKMFADYEDRFQLFLFIALGLLIFEMLLSNTKNKFLSKLNLFAENKS